MGQKNLGLEGFHFIWRIITSLSAMNFYTNFSLTKFVLLPWNFLSLRNLVLHNMSWTSKEIISLQKFYYCFKVFFLLGILIRILDMVVLKESFLGLSFSKKISLKKTYLKMPLWVTGMFCICLTLHILSSKYFAGSFRAFLALKFPSSWTNFFTFWLIRLPCVNSLANLKSLV